MGAGFHMELTGKENIYLNGSLLGFTRKEMDEKFERIIDFAELWDFIDAPPALIRPEWLSFRFAVATDSMPDILIVDEVSVGDTAFRDKASLVSLLSERMVVRSC
jgi:ABC-type polysaccharide/polyol phosphate transport system ATPase subunit